jgi:hypothetical protein
MPVETVQRPSWVAWWRLFRAAHEARKAAESKGQGQAPQDTRSRS